MSHQIQTTKAFVINSHERGEADKMFVLYTELLGLVYVDAKGIRKESSKLRSFLNSTGLFVAELLPVRSGYRIVGASGTHSMSEFLSSENRAAFARILNLFSKLVYNSLKDEKLFYILSDSHNLLVSAEFEDVESLECVCVARMLERLGYFPRDKSPLIFENSIEVVKQRLRDVNTRRKVISEINEIMYELHS
ncbi:MAG: recombination protein O N-terminal domain-containing protein [Candidatus Campbellbacteria bacterium]|nr:recombination protein O N-terminal domain-containing protein [Candidatus Campbellbacteria bacterium]